MVEIDNDLKENLDEAEREVFETNEKIEPEKQSTQSNNVHIIDENNVTGNAATDPIAVEKVDLESFNAEDEKKNSGIKMDLLMNLALNVSIELGRTEMQIKDILKLGIGSIVELNKLAGEPVDLLVNNKKFAEGEVVVIDENFGVRITGLVNSSTEIDKISEVITQDS